MNSESLSSVFARASQTHGDALVHLLISWLKCARILIAEESFIAPEVLQLLQSRAFFKMDSTQFDFLAQQLGKDDLIVVPSGYQGPINLPAKIVGFGNPEKSWDGFFIKALDVSAVVYFDQALAAFRGGFNDLLESTKYLFLDRDGVIIDYVSYPKQSSQVALQTGIVEVIKEYRKRNYRIVMITNQSGIARGYSSQEDFRQVQNRTLELLAQHGQWIDSCYFATYLPKSNNIQTLQYPSLRKPRVGMLAEEAQFWSIDFDNSVMIGDNASDVEWAQNAGLGRVFWLDNPELRESSPADLKNVIQIKNLGEVLQHF